MSPDPPGSIQELARRRADARGRREWTVADQLRAEIEAAGWAVVDQGLDFNLEPAQPPDVVEGGRVRYGSSIAVPSLLSEPATERVSLVLIAPDRREALDEVLAGLRQESSAGIPLVIVANAPEADMEEALADAEVAGATEVLWLGQRSSPAAAANAGLRRASGSVVVLLDERVRPSGDIVSPLVDALLDPSVAVAGALGLDSVDLRRWLPAGPGVVDALAWGALAFRRADFLARGPLEGRFQLDRSLGPWWSLVLRDDGPDAPPRGALAVPLPLDVSPSQQTDDDPSLARAIKRDFYRLIDRFGQRYDLLASPAPKGRARSGP
ncbi:MAG: hypothetical protein M3395_07965 [Chloroflexota bacterium]|nr:hypothetical protein [Chloroflexota bacterium]